MKKLLLLLLLSIILYSCKETNIDYSDKNNWLQISENKNNEVDVFYLYPTVWYGEGTNKDFVCPIDFKPMRENATNALISQSTVFEEVGNIYAPFYRQADALYILEQNDGCRFQLITFLLRGDKSASYCCCKPFKLVKKSCHAEMQQGGD